MTVTLGTIFEKTVSWMVILKIVGATPQVVELYELTRNLSGHFFIYIGIYEHSIQLFIIS